MDLRYVYVGLVWLRVLNWTHVIVEQNMRRFVVKNGTILFFKRSVTQLGDLCNH